MERTSRELNEKNEIKETRSYRVLGRTSFITWSRSDGRAVNTSSWRFRLEIYGLTTSGMEYIIACMTWHGVPTAMVQYDAPVRSPFWVWQRDGPARKGEAFLLNT